MGGPAAGGWHRDPQGPTRRRACCSVNSLSLQAATGGRSDLRASPASSLGWDGDPPPFAVCLTPFSLRAVCSTAALRLVWLVLVCPRGSGALSPGPFSVKEDHRWLRWAGRLQGATSPGVSLSEAAKGRDGRNDDCLPTVCLMTYTPQLSQVSQQSCTVGILIISTFSRRKPRLRERNGLVQGYGGAEP